MGYLFYTWARPQPNIYFEQGPKFFYFGTRVVWWCNG